MPVQEIYNNRQHMIFNVSELDQVNFNEVLETGPDTVRKSVNETKTFVKWDGEMPSCVFNLTTKEGPYTHEEMLSILSTTEWSETNLFNI
jgi:hypothetical protein